MKESFQNVFIGESTLDFADFSLKERDQGATITLPGMAWVFSLFSYVFVHTRAWWGGGEALRAESEPLTSVASKVRSGISAWGSPPPLQSPLAVLVHRMGETRGAQRRRSTL